jgi:polyphosphate glucokinase
MRVLVIDVGGSHVKLLATGATEPRRFDSGEHLTPERLVSQVRELAEDWDYDAVSLGYPGEAGPEGPISEPGNLGPGWVGYDFGAAFGHPVRVINDAAMQALGAYSRGRMLFLGLGTGLGSALVAERVVIPLELGCLPFGSDETLFDRLGKAGREKHGTAAWSNAVAETAAVLRKAFVVDEVVLGGGHAEEVDPLPDHVRRGGNEDAFAGGFRLWERTVEPYDRHPPHVWRVLS